MLVQQSAFRQTEAHPADSLCRIPPIAYTMQDLQLHVLQIGSRRKEDISS